MKKTKKFGFSMVEGLILLVVAAIAIAAMTPIITRKIVNVSDVGATLGGANHGRYEYYTKEYLIFGDNTENPDRMYEKVLDDDRNNSNTPKILIYEKVIDNDTETVYEELTGLDPSDPDKNGVVSEATGCPKDKKNCDLKKDVMTYKRSDKYVFEDGKTTYRITDGNGKEKNPKFDPNRNRIIESKLTTKKPEKSKDNNNLWAVQKDSPEYKGKVKPIPWERLFSGSHEVYDRKVEKDPDDPPDEPLHATFTPPDNATDIVIHAVGGGGAGGGLSEDALRNGWATTEDIGKSLSPERKKELEAMKKRLQEKFKGLGYVTLGFAKDGIEVTIDVKEGHDGQYIFPDFFEYTDHLGAGTQKPDIFKMPDWWFNWNTIYNSGYETGAVACGGKGGDAGDVEWTTNESTNDNVACMISKYANDMNYSGFVCDKHHTETDSVTGETKEGRCIAGTCKKGSCNSSWYICNDYSISDYRGVLELDCGKMNIKRTTNGYLHKYPGGKGGKSPGCVYISKKINNPISISQGCSGPNGESGKPIKTSAKMGENIDVTKLDGTSGKTCYITVDGKKGLAVGGTGGKGCVQMQVSQDVFKAAKIFLSKSNTNLLAEENDSTYHDIGEHKDYTTDPSATTTDTAGSSGQNPDMEAGKLLDTSTVGPSEFKDVLKQAVSDTDYFKENPGATAFEYFAEIYGGTYCPDDAVIDYLMSLYGGSMELSNFILGMKMSVTNSALTGIYVLSEPWMCKALPTYTGCGKNGSPGLIIGGKRTSGGLPAGFSSAAGIYNEKYTWVIPYGTKYLSYGEAGEPGNYATTKVSKVSGTIELFIGKGGNWVDVDHGYTVDPGWKKGKNGPNGTDTYIKINDKEVLRAKGGKGGKGALNTSKYDMCFKGDQNKSCKDSNGHDVTCCTDTRTTKEVKNTMSRPSAFENIRSFVQNSTIIGIGLGRGAEGAGSTGGNDFLLGEIKVYNNTGSAGRQKKVDLKKALNVGESALKTNPLSAASADYYQPQAMDEDAIQALSYKGGDGGVIITW